MQLLNSPSRAGSATFELLISLVLIAGVSVGVYAMQHPHESPQQQITAAIQQ